MGCVISCCKKKCKEKHKEKSKIDDNNNEKSNCSSINANEDLSHVKMNPGPLINNFFKIKLNSKSTKEKDNSSMANIKQNKIFKELKEIKAIIQKQDETISKSYRNNNLNQVENAGNVIQVNDAKNKNDVNKLQNNYIIIETSGNANKKHPKKAHKEGSVESLIQNRNGNIINIASNNSSKLVIENSIDKSPAQHESQKSAKSFESSKKHKEKANNEEEKNSANNIKSKDNSRSSFLNVMNNNSNQSQLLVNYKTFVKGRSFTNFTNEYEVGNVLGEGSYGKVKKVKHKLTKQVRAMKIIRKDETGNFEEIDNLMNLNHPNIVKIFEFFHDENFVYIIMEYCKGGELFDKIKEYEHFNEKDASKIIKAIMQAVAYCHGKGIIHRDLKPENILLDGDDLSQLKIIDFGASILKKDNINLKERYGTSYYVAPEVLKGNYDEKCDIWSIGVIMYILLTGRPPFNGKNENEICRKILKGSVEYSINLFSAVSSEATDLLKKLLVKNQEKRISVIEALKHPWIKNLASKAKVNKFITSKIYKNLTNFGAKSKMQEAVITYITNQLTSNEEIKQLRKIFLEIDENGDGVLVKEELHKGLIKVYGAQMTREESDKIFDNIDADGNGTISYDEFIRASIDKKNILSEEKLKTAYNLFDTNGDGNIEAREIREVLGVVGNNDDVIWDKLIQEADLDGNGLIDYEEFKIMMEKLYLK